MNYWKLLSIIAIALILISAFSAASKIRPVSGLTPLLSDPGFDASVDSDDLRTNTAGVQDWYESRGGFSNGNSSLLTLDTNDIGGNKGKKAALKTYGYSTNAYLTQELNPAQSGIFTVSFDIYIDRIQDNSDHDATGPVFIGSNHVTTNAPCGTSAERFVYFCFYDPTPGDTGNDIQIRANTANSPWTDTSAWTRVGTDLTLSYDTWYTITLAVNVTGDYYNLTVLGNTYRVNRNSAYAGGSSVYYIVFDADGDKRGDFYIDNVFSPALETQMEVVPEKTEIVLGQEFTVYINITKAIDLYGWEFQFNYNPSVLDLTYTAIVDGGLKTPTQTFMSLVNETGGHLWWAVSTTYPTTTGITYYSHAIFEMRFKAIDAGTSNLSLFGTILSDSHASPIPHTVVDSSVTVGTVDLTVEEIKICNMYGNETWTHSIYANDTYTDSSPYYYPVNVTVKNNGNMNAGSFKVKLQVYYEESLEAESEISVDSLAASSTIKITFSNLFHPTKTGDTGKYKLKATADSQNEIYESDEDNNVKTKEDFLVTLMGDINGDKKVNVLDAVTIALAWNGKPGDAQWNVAADLNHDNEVNILDGSRMGLTWGKTW